MTIDGGHGKVGSRTPGVWFCSDVLHICMGMNGNVNYISSGASKRFPKDKWIKIEIQQQIFNNRYIYSIRLNGEEVENTVNTTPKEFSNVRVYVTNPWSSPQPGSIRNLVIRTAPN